MLRALLCAALLGVACASVPSEVFQGSVTDVRPGTEWPTGDATVTITVGWDVGTYFEQSTFTFPEHSREGVLFREVGTCVLVRRAGESVRWNPCR